MSEPALRDLRADIAAQLRENARQAGAMGTSVPEAEPYRLLREPNEPGDVGPPATSSGRFDYMLDQGSPPEAPYIEQATAGIAGQKPPDPKQAPAMARDAGRAVLREMSGGATEDVAKAVAGAPAQAGMEVQANTLESMSPQQMAELIAKANPEQRQAIYSIVKPHWQPGTRTDAQGETGKDPNAVRAAFGLQDVADTHAAQGLQQTQAADRSQYEMLQKVQQNEMRATQTFKAENDALHDRYNQERQQQFDRMAAIQKAMDKVPNAPRTIAQWVDKSGTGQKIALGLAAAFSVLGGAVLRDGGKSVQTMLGNVQANIDRGVQGEKAQYDALGQRMGASQSIYGNLRQALGDDQQALNITKAMYYDAAANAVQQIATQYKMDMQAPQIQQLLQHLAEQRQKLVLDTASTMQNQFSQSDKFNPGGVTQIGGGAAAGNYKSTDLDKDTQKISKELDERGYNMGDRAIGLYQKAIKAMQEGGFAKDEKFWRQFAAFNSANSPAGQAAILARLDEPKRRAMQLIIKAGAEGLKDSSGKSVTANELARDVMAHGGYSIDSLDEVRRIIADNRRQIYNSTAAGYDPRIPSTYDARKDLQGIQNAHAGIATDERQPIDTSDLATRVEGRLRK